jgi:hypothetical protein
MKTSLQQAAILWLQGFLTASPAAQADIKQSCPYPKQIDAAIEALAYRDAEGLYHLQTNNLTANLSR